MTIHCPTCNKPMDVTALELDALHDIPMTRTQHMILQALMDRYPRPASIDAIMEAIWGDDPNGGPLYARNNINVHIWRMRKMLRPHKWTVSNSRVGFGHRGLYKLEKV